MIKSLVTFLTLGLFFCVSGLGIAYLSMLILAQLEWSYTTAAAISLVVSVFLIWRLMNLLNLPKK